MQICMLFTLRLWQQTPALSFKTITSLLELLGGWKEQSQLLEDGKRGPSSWPIEPILEGREWPPSREQRRKRNQKSAVCMQGSVTDCGGVLLSLGCNRHESTRKFRHVDSVLTNQKELNIKVCYPTLLKTKSNNVSGVQEAIKTII